MSDERPIKPDLETIKALVADIAAAGHVVNIPPKFDLGMNWAEVPPSTFDVVDASYSTTTRVLRVRFRDGFEQLIRWDSLPESRISPEIEPHTVRPSEFGDSLIFIRSCVPEEVYDVDSVPLRLHVDEVDDED